MKLIKLTIQEKLQMLFGNYYLVNKHTKEIHDLRKKSANCRIPLLAKHNKWYVGEKKMRGLLYNGFNGCRWCMKEYDKG